VKRRPLIGLVMVALAGGGAGFALGWLARSPALPDVPALSPGQVPDVRGLPRGWAELLLTNVGLLPVVNPIAGSKDDVVVAQKPGPGAKAPPASRVELDVRCAPLPCPAPPPGKSIFDPCSCASR